VAETDAQAAYRRDAATLAGIGSVLRDAELPRIEVRLPVALAEAAVRAWEWDDEGELSSESSEQRQQRHRAGALALIGLAISERGQNLGDEVVVGLAPELIGAALDAADDLLDQPS
jgi:hypothetical protein